MGTDPHGRALLNDTSLNKGTGFSAAEREALGLRGLVPTRVESLEEQLARIDHKYRRLDDETERHIFLRALQDTSEVLFYRYLTERLTDLLPIVYTPTVGGACEHFSHIYRRPHGLFIDADRIDDLDVVDRFVDAVADRYPGVLLQWEDFAQHHATDLLARHRDRILSFNDDIQGTAAVALAAVQAGVAANGTSLADARVVIVGAGSAGTGIAGMLLGAGLATANLFLVDADGLLHDRRNDLADYQLIVAQPWEAVAAWADHDGATPLAQVVASARPTVLIGVSGQAGLFTETIVRSMASWSSHPIVLPLSNPTSRAEAKPTDVLTWASGQALVAKGSPFGDVHLRRTHACRGAVQQHLRLPRPRHGRLGRPGHNGDRLDVACRGSSRRGHQPLHPRLSNRRATATPDRRCQHEPTHRTRRRRCGPRRWRR